jgi:hypothetical protein
MAFRVFDAYGAASRPEATLRASGYLFLSKGIMKRAGKEGATHCQLRYDESDGRLGIWLTEASSESGEGGVRPMLDEKSGASINLLPLLRYYGFPELKEKQVLPVTFEDDLVVIKLFEEIVGSSAPAAAPARQPMNQTEEFDDDIPF